MKVTRKTPEDRIARRRSFVPVKYQQLYERCIAGTASPREAIKMNCLECWAHVRHETASCDNYACALWQYRPYQGSAQSAPLDELDSPEAKTAKDSQNTTNQHQENL